MGTEGKDPRPKEMHPHPDRAVCAATSSEHSKTLAQRTRSSTDTVIL